MKTLLTQWVNSDNENVLNVIVTHGQTITRSTLSTDAPIREILLAVLYVAATSSRLGLVFTLSASVRFISPAYFSVHGLRGLSMSRVVSQMSRDLSVKDDIKKSMLFLEKML